MGCRGPMCMGTTHPMGRQQAGARTPPRGLCVSIYPGYGIIFHTRASLQVRPSASLRAVRAAPVPVRLDVSPTHPCTLVGHRTSGFDF